jgi:hypothetical protein
MKTIVAIAVVSIMALSLPAFEANAEPARYYAPGQQAKRSSYAHPARYYAPGQQAKRSSYAHPARYYAPGQRATRPYAQPSRY